MLKPNQSRPDSLDDAVPLNLSSILLVEPDPELRDSRRLLLSALRHPVLAVSAYTEVCALPADSNCGLVAIDICPNEYEASRIAAHARRTWPNAKILLLGHPSDDFDDPLYDDAVSPFCNPSGIVESAHKLLRVREWRPKESQGETSSQSKV
jgi:DNA-binding NtrC family response regulator